jgi:hypothetical protein
MLPCVGLASRPLLFSSRHTCGQTRKAVVMMMFWMMMMMMMMMIEEEDDDDYTDGDNVAVRGLGQQAVALQLQAHLRGARDVTRTREAE